VPGAGSRLQPLAFTVAAGGHRTVVKRLVVQDRAQAGLGDPADDRYRPRPSTAIADSQTVKAAETVAGDQRGYDAAKKINGRKRHLAVDTQGLPLLVMVAPADRTDRDLLARLRMPHL
jgi:hypothetical protein